MVRKIKCSTCGIRVKETPHELRIQTQEGIHTVPICEDCARFWDMSTQVLYRPKDKTPKQEGVIND